MSKTVLIVEDRQEVREASAEMLREQGYRVLEAESGTEAVTLARSEMPDLILMDVSIPELNGFDATARLKALPETSAIPIVAVTALTYDDERSGAFDGYLAKPVTPRRLLREVRTYLAPVPA
ncbi:MAG: response regulator [Longimicrobiales bacterium]